jgi:hypothetical protein
MRSVAESKESNVMRNTSRFFGGLIAVAVVLGSQPQTTEAQALSMAGDWTLEVTSQNGVTNPTLTLQQNGTALTGRYRSTTLGDHDVTGTVNGRNATVDFTAEIEGLGEAPLAYTGSVSAEGVWSGELVADIQGQSFPLGTFTATRAAR